ncbi:hypothetical protein [Granulicella sibirica]|uniref:hypothetical protein n=1 Tax=Granulicella sibirica TaxID=2479048 RepID=UPI00100879B3|nr:hypothetical protein [Granulicella sibirica]
MGRHLADFLTELDVSISEIEGHIDRLSKLRDQWVAARKKAGELGELVHRRGGEELPVYLNQNGQLAGFVSPALQKPGVSDPLWKQLAFLMRSESFTIPEAIKKLEGSAGRDLGKNGYQKIRNSILRHGETFKKNENGTYDVIITGLSGGPPSLEKLLEL